MVKKIVYIEGDSIESKFKKSTLREGFSYLLSNGSHSNNIEIRMGKSREKAIAFFVECKQLNKFLLIDLENNEDNRQVEIKKLGLNNCSNYYFMVQQCEAWFLSQPTILDKYYNINFSDKCSDTDAKAVRNPKKEIDDILKANTNNTRKYKEIEDGSLLLKKLNIEKLQQDFSDVQNLITALSN